MATHTELEMILTQMHRSDERLDDLAKALGEVAGHCATLVERTTHLATREDVTAAIRTHSQDCKASRVPKPRNANGNMGRLIKAVAAFLTVAAAALAAWMGFSN